jgi:hypothetical protein
MCPSCFLLLHVLWFMHFSMPFTCLALWTFFYLAMLLLYSYYSYIYVHSFLNFLHIGCFTSCSYIIMFLRGIFSFVLVVGASKFYDFLHVSCLLTFLSTCFSFTYFSCNKAICPLSLLVFVWFPLGVVILTCIISNCNHYLIFWILNCKKN